MVKFFAKILLGNLFSKLLLIAAEAMAFLGVGAAQFGAFAFCQGLIFTGATIAVWGKGQALIGVVGRVREAGNVQNTMGFIRKSRHEVAMLSIVLASTCVIGAFFSQVNLGLLSLVLIALIIVAEAQLILNAAILRSNRMALKGILYLDGLRHLALASMALLTLVTDANFLVLLFGWAAAAFVSLIAGYRAVTRAVPENACKPIATATLDHAAGISKFSGMWSVAQLVYSRFAIIFGAYILPAQDLGATAFFIKLMVIFTFLHTVMSQAFAPSIGRLSLAENFDQARRVYDVSTFFLAATVLPAIGLCVLNLDLILAFFKINWTHALLVPVFLFWVQGLNIATGIIGQFIIHFGHARALFYISVGGASIQCALMFTLGVIYGVNGILTSYAISNLFLTIAKNVFAARKMGVHGTTLPNLAIFAGVVAAYFGVSVLADFTTLTARIASNVSFVLVAAAVIAISGYFVPGVVNSKINRSLS